MSVADLFSRRRLGAMTRRDWREVPDQSARQRERAKRYQNHTNPLTGHVTHGLKPGAERGLVPK